MAFAVLTLIMMALSFTTEAINIHKVQPPVLMANESEAAKVWTAMEKSTQEAIESLIKKILPSIIRSGGSDDITINPKCMSDLLRIFNGVRELRLWALNLLDAMGKPGSGMLQGTSAFYGSYYQCLDVRFPPRAAYGRSPVQEQTTGQYCILEFRIPLPPTNKNRIKTTFDTSAFRNTTFKTEAMEQMRSLSNFLYEGGLRIAICIPSTCGKDDIYNILKMASAKLPVPTHASIYSCETTYERYPDQVETGILLFLLALCILVVLATVYEYTLLSRAAQKDHNLPQSLLLAFSMRQSMRNVSEIGPSSKNPLKSLNGLRVITMSWVLLGHSYISMEPQMLRNPIPAITKMREDFFFEVIGNSYFTVQTFLLISSVLISYISVTKMDKNGLSAFDISILYLRRAWRMVMPEMLVITIIILLPIMGSGPIYQDMVDMFAGNCRRTWWRNLLSIQNIYKDYYRCLDHSWYVAVDIQLYLVALVYLFLLSRKSNLAKIFLVAIGLFSVASTGIVTYIFSYPPTFLISVVDITFAIEFAQNVYMSSYTYASCYAVGMALGTFLARNPDFKMKRKWVVIGWLSSVSMALFLVYIVYLWNAIEYPSNILSAIYAALHNFLWALCVGWVILACATGNAGPVRSLLSWNGYVPMVRISYMIYLVHFQVMYYYGATRLGPVDVSNTSMVWQFFSIIGSSVIVSLILRVIAEGPMIQLNAIFVQWLSGSNKRKQSPEEPELVKNGNTSQNLSGEEEKRIEETEMKSK